MLGRSATEQQQKNLDVILEESERLLTLINQLLDIEKIEAGRSLSMLRPSTWRIFSPGFPTVSPSTARVRGSSGGSAGMNRFP